MPIPDMISLIGILNEGSDVSLPSEYLTPIANNTIPTTIKLIPIRNPILHFLFLTMVNYKIKKASTI